MPSRRCHVVVGHGHGPLRMLLAPLLATLSALLGVVDGDGGHHLLSLLGSHPCFPGQDEVQSPHCWWRTGW
jgi:hypothetical protein